MSYAGLAKRMTDIGMPMQKTTIFKIEEGDPPRSVSIDELIGFATVFDMDVAPLLLPIELVNERRATEALAAARKTAREITRAVLDLHAQWQRVTELGAYRIPTQQRHTFGAYLGEACDAESVPEKIAEALRKLPNAFAAADREAR